MLETNKRKIIGILFIFIGLYTLYTNKLEANIVHTISVKEAHQYIQNNSNITILDIRSKDEFEDDGYLFDAKLIPLYLLSGKMNSLNKNKIILVYCHSGKRSSLAADLLSKNGFRVLNLKGGMSSWVDHELPYVF